MSILCEQQVAPGPKGPLHSGKDVGTEGVEGDNFNDVRCDRFLAIARRNLLALDDHPSIPSIPSVRTMPTPTSDKEGKARYWHENQPEPFRLNVKTEHDTMDLKRVDFATRRRSNSGDLYTLRISRKRQAESESETVLSADVFLDFSEFHRRFSRARQDRDARQRHGGNHPEQKQKHKHKQKRLSPWLIPINHPFKVLWDIATVVFSFAYAHATHTAIRDRKFDSSLFMMFCEVWFFVDLLLNFVTERRTESGEVLRDLKSVCARYLTTWFAVDALSLFPWENILVRPIIEMQNRRNVFHRLYLRSRVILRYTPRVRGRHIRWFNRLARHTKNHGIGYSRFVRLIVKYVPKYLLFARHMKGVIAVRLLRQVNHLRRFYNNIVVGSQTEDDDADDGDHDGDDSERSFAGDDVSLSPEDDDSDIKVHQFVHRLRQNRQSLSGSIEGIRRRSSTRRSCADDDDDDLPLPW